MKLWSRLFALGLTANILKGLFQPNPPRQTIVWNWSRKCILGTFGDQQHMEMIGPYGCNTNATSVSRMTSVTLHTTRLRRWKYFYSLVIETTVECSVGASTFCLRPVSKDLGATIPPPPLPLCWICVVIGMPWRVTDDIHDDIQVTEHMWQVTHVTYGKNKKNAKII
jgi:hypothetical protein